MQFADNPNLNKTEEQEQYKYKGIEKTILPYDMYKKVVRELSIVKPYIKKTRVNKEKIVEDENGKHYELIKEDLEEKDFLLLEDLYTKLAEYFIQNKNNEEIDLQKEGVKYVFKRLKRDIAPTITYLTEIARRLFTYTTSMLYTKGINDYTEEEDAFIYVMNNISHIQAIYNYIFLTNIEKIVESITDEDKQKVLENSKTILESCKDHFNLLNFTDAEEKQLINCLKLKEEDIEEYKQQYEKAKKYNTTKFPIDLVSKNITKQGTISINNALKNNPSAQMQLNLLMKQGNTQNLLEKFGLEEEKTEFDFIVLVHIYNIISNKVKAEFDINEIKYKLSQNKKYSIQGNIHKTDLDEEIEKSIIKWYNTIFELHISEEMQPFFDANSFDTLRQYTSKGKPVLPIVEFNTRNKNGTDVKSYVLSEETPSSYFMYLNLQKKDHKQVISAPNKYLALSSETLGTDSKLNLTISNILAETITRLQGHKKRYGGTKQENKQLYKINFNTIYDACKDEIAKDSNTRRKKQTIRNQVYKLLENVYKKQLGIIKGYKEYTTKNNEIGVEIIGIKPKEDTEDEED